MKRVSELYGVHRGADIYVVGTGTSLRVFPLDFLNGKVTIGLNMAWKMYKDFDYCITIHPDLNVPLFLPGEEQHHNEKTKWVTGYEKAKKLLSSTQFEYAQKHFYRFDYRGQANTAPPHEPSTAGRVLEWVEQPSGDNLYVWSSISQAGVNLAANLGAKNVILIGCDNCALLQNHHSHKQHTRWKGVHPDHRYDQYHEGLVEVRRALRKRGVNLITASAFLGLDRFEQDFTLLADELKVPVLVENHDVSGADKMDGGVRRKILRSFENVTSKIRATLQL